MSFALMFTTSTFRCLYRHLFIYYLIWGNSPQRGRDPSFAWFIDQTKRRSTVGRTFLDQEQARRRDLYLTTHNNHKRQTTMPPAGFEPEIPAGEQQQTYALDSAATGIGCIGIFLAQHPPVGQGHLINVVYRSINMTHHSR